MGLLQHNWIWKLISLVIAFSLWLWVRSEETTNQRDFTVLLDVSVHVDGNLSLAQAHEVGHAVSQRIQRELPVVTDAVVHVEPVDDEAHG